MNIFKYNTSSLGWLGELERFSRDPERMRGNLIGDFAILPSIFKNIHTLYLPAI